MDKAIDFDRYDDAHVLSDLDLAWWVAQVERDSCASTTRPACSRVCAARSKLVEADLRALGLPTRFDMVELGFHAFAELVTSHDAALALARFRLWSPERFEALVAAAGLEVVAQLRLSARRLRARAAARARVGAATGMTDYASRCAYCRCA